jgi:lysophospholipase L1-like esterase
MPEWQTTTINDSSAQRGCVAAYLWSHHLKHLTFPSLLLTTLILAACGGGSGTTGSTADGSAQSLAASNATVTPSSGDVTDTSTPATSSSSSSSSTQPSTTPTSTTSTPTTSTTTQIVEYYGDSTIYGYRSGSGGQVAKPAPAAFAEALPASGKYDVRNEGVSGTTACDLLNGTDGVHPAWSSQMTSSKAKYVLVNFAINDEWKYDMNTYKSCMHSLAQTAAQHGKQMIFETPNPTRDSGPGGLDTMVAAMKEVASQEGIPVIDQYQYLTNYLNGASPYSICPDGLHPTDAVYIMKGQYAASVFTTLFK